MRNMEKQATTGHEIVRRRPNLDLVAGDLLQLNQMVKENDILYGLVAAYFAGLASGIRNARPTDPENIYGAKQFMNFCDEQ